MMQLYENVVNNDPSAIFFLTVIRKTPGMCFYKYSNNLGRVFYYFRRPEISNAPSC
jgi:hypothetical protein